MSLKDQGAQRRRGKALDEALLAAAWDELVEHGYGRLTYEGVARRAGTSRPVVYRRWPTKQDLVVAVVRNLRSGEPPVRPDTGALRGDVIAAMSEMSRRRSGLVTVMSLRLAEYFEETGTSFADLRALMLEGAHDVFAEILERAVARGEADPARITPRIAALPFDLLRHELFMTLKPVPRKVIEEIVDTIFLPLVRPLP